MAVMRQRRSMPKLTDLLTALPDARLHLPVGGHASEAAVRALAFDSVSTDSRTLEPGALFVGLSGPRFDGAAFVASARSRGAVAALLSAGNEASITVDVPLIVVPDALTALQQWARHWRAAWPGCCIAVTGSNGKTTVKQMIHAIARRAVGDQACWATPGNLNNHIGVPLSVLGLQPRHRMAVFELGMNHPDEIALLAGIAQPRIALVNNAQREHQEFMKSVEAVAQENGQVLCALPDDGVAVFPRDPAHEAIWISQAQGQRRRLIRFGFASAAAAPGFSGKEVLGRWESSDSGDARLAIRFPDQREIHIKPLGLGEHFALNMIAAAACGFAAGCGPDQIAEALSAFEPVRGRGRPLALHAGGILVDDTYNANPDSVRAAIDALVRMQAPRALVLGDMGEVGDEGPRFHREVLHYAEDQKLDAIWLHGEALALAHAETGIGQHRAELVALIADLRGWVAAQQARHRDPSVWIKGSRFMQMERVVQALAVEQEGRALCC